MTATEQKLLDAVRRLEELGSAEAIAQLLREQGIKGYRKVSTDCPIARYLSREIDASEHGFAVAVDYEPDSAVLAGVKEVTIHLLNDWGDDEYGETIYEVIGSFVAPESVSEFVRRFDDGDFPDLALPWDQWPA
ncbi:MAG TPA: hypothetical protein VIK75_00350 [Calditerricola sp.]